MVMIILFYQNDLFVKKKKIWFVIFRNWEISHNNSNFQIIRKASN